MEISSSNALENRVQKSQADKVSFSRSWEEEGIGKHWTWLSWCVCVYVCVWLDQRLWQLLCVANGVWERRSTRSNGSSMKLPRRHHRESRERGREREGQRLIPLTRHAGGITKHSAPVLPKHAGEPPTLRQQHHHHQRCRRVHFLVSL